MMKGWMNQTSSRSSGKSSNNLNHLGGLRVPFFIGNPHDRTRPNQEDASDR
jgi:hypothetical protein